jgi:3-dehydroquinate dehydratase / shikimate dehydrogenase
MTYLCIAIFAHTPEQVQRDTAAAAEAGADLVELRLDHLTDHDVIRRVVGQSDRPCILTCRPMWEGGHSSLGNRERVDLLGAAAAGMGSGARYVDVELKTYNDLDLGERAEINRPVIVSAHDFDGRPDRLYNIIAEMNAAPADVNKTVWTARTVRDNLEAFEILQQRQKPTIALCMGEAGLISRVLAKKFGAFLTFASLTRGGGTAPGQVPVEDMKRLYRWDAIGPRTKVYGVVASPVAHSMSPAIHNAAFDRTGHDGVYLPLLVNPGYESFKAFMESFLHFEGLDLSGLSVTLPHKENALRYLKEKGADVEPLAERIGAVNTIVVNREGGAPTLRGINTDYGAILDSITAKLNVTREALANYRVAVIGAGGTGRTAVAALAHCGATVVVYNRTKDRADALAAEFNGQTGKVVAARLEKLCDSCCQVYVNTTSVGMHPNVDASPLGDDPPALTPDKLVFDTIYNPPKTKLLQHAEARGAKTIGGIEMFVRQAAAQFEAWTGQTAPADVMRRVVEHRLGVTPED